jgi:hypothetical protein
MQAVVVAEQTIAVQLALVVLAVVATAALQMTP